MTRQIDWDDLRIFLAVSRGQNITSVARKLKVDQSTVSRRVAHLESDLGVRLLERTRERLVLTEFGKKLVVHAESMERGALALAELASGELGEDAPPLVRIATYEGISSFYLAECLAGFQEHAAVRLEIVLQLKPVNVSVRDADLFLSFYEPEGRGLDKLQAGTITMRLYASKAYLDKHGVPGSRDDLARHKFISFIPEMLGLPSARFLDEAIAKRVEVMNSTSMASQMAAAAGGMGIVMVPAFAARREPRLLPVLAREIEVKREVWLSAHEDLRYTPRVKALMAFLHKRLMADQDIMNDDPRIDNAPS